MKTLHQTPEIKIDGATGEGGGQILRSALTLSSITGRSFRLDRIRAGRRRPGLMRQHLTCVEAVASICGARTTELSLGCESLCFWPGEIRACHETFAIGTAGSTSLLMQTILPTLLHASESSQVCLSGGTHVIQAPCFEYLDEIFLPQLRRMDARARLSLERHGFFPAGGGRIELAVEPSSLEACEWHAPNVDLSVSAQVLSTPEISPSVAEKELRTASRQLELTAEQCASSSADGAACPGNALLLRAKPARPAGDHPGTLCFAFGERGKPARRVAQQAVGQMRRYLGSPASVDEHLADQLLLPLALAGGGGFTTVALTPHFHSNAEVIEAFLPVKIETESLDRLVSKVTIRS